MSPRITDLTATATTPRERARGLLAWLRFRLDDVVLVDGVSLRRTRDGRHTLSYPVRHDGQGRQHPVVRPVDDAARVAIEDAVFEVLGLSREASP